MKIEKITDQAIRSLQLPVAGKQIILREKYVLGFAVRKTATGCIAFIFNYSFSGRDRRFTIGQHPAWTVVAARARAIELRRLVDRGIDPFAERLARSNEITVRQFYEEYKKTVLPSKALKTRSEEMKLWSRFLLPALGAKPLLEVSHSQVDRLHRTVSVDTPVQANRMISALRKAFSIAVRWGYIESNPASGVELNSEEPRQRFLSPQEQSAFLSALAAKGDNTSTLAIWFMMLNGARSGEVFSADWAQFDLRSAIWTKPSSHTKQRRIHRVPLSNAALAILVKAQKMRSGRYVFTRPDGRPVRSVKKIFRSVCEEAGITDFRPHDLRHHYASLLAMEGVSLHVIGKLLGHSQPSTTSRYAHLADEPLRAATELAAKKL